MPSRIHTRRVKNVKQLRERNQGSLDVCKSPMTLSNNCDTVFLRGSERRCGFEWRRALTFHPQVRWQTRYATVMPIAHLHLLQNRLRTSHPKLVLCRLRRSTMLGTQLSLMSVGLLTRTLSIEDRLRAMEFSARLLHMKLTLGCCSRNKARVRLTASFPLTVFPDLSMARYMGTALAASAGLGNVCRRHTILLSFCASSSCLT